MSNMAAGSESGFSLKVFVQSLLVVALFYALLAAWLWRAGPRTVLKLQATLPSQSAVIEFPPAPVTPPVANYGPPVPQNTSPQPTAAVGNAAASLPPAPIEGLYEVTPKGPLPVIREKDKLTPFKAYRRPFDRAAAKGPIVSIAIVDMGISDSAAQSALGTMPPEISFDLSPYAANPDQFVTAAREKGHEVWLTLPVESEDYPRVDTGADTLLIGMPEQQNAVKLAEVLGSTAGYAGVITSQNPAFMKSVSDMKPILNAIYDRGLGFVDASDTPGTEPQTMAMGRNAPYTNVDVWLDMSANPDDINAALAKLEQRARDHGSAVGLIHPLPVSYQEVLKWVGTLKGKGLVLAPLSAQTGL